VPQATTLTVSAGLVTAAGLGQATAEQLTDRQQRDQVYQRKYGLPPWARSVAGHASISITADVYGT
jgi:hypothetical protein